MAGKSKLTFQLSVNSLSHIEPDGDKARLILTVCMQNLRKQLPVDFKDEKGEVYATITRVDYNLPKGVITAQVKAKSKFNPFLDKLPLPIIREEVVVLEYVPPIE